MSEPFAFLDEEEQDDDRSGIAWLPLTLAALALAGFLMIPILGIFRNDKGASDWSNYNQDDLLVSLDSTENFGPGLENLEPLLTPSPEDLRDNLMSVDETLSSLGDNYVPPASGNKKNGFSIAIEQQASGHIKGKRKSPTKKTTTIPSTGKRIPAVQTPTETSVAGNPAASHEITVQPGDTLYGIARRTGSTREEIARLNGISPDAQLKVGQKLKIPGNAPVTAQRRPVSAGQPTSAGQPALPRQTFPPRRAPKIVSPTPQFSSYSGPGNQALPRSGNAPYIPRQSGPTTVDPGLFPGNTAPGSTPNPLDRYNNAVAYRVQPFDSLDRIADALATTPEELIELNGRSTVRKGEMLVVPVDNCMVKD